MRGRFLFEKSLQLRAIASIAAVIWLAACSNNLGGGSNATNTLQDTTPLNDPRDDEDIPDDNPGFFTDLKPGTEVGRLQVEVPPTCPFVLRGTLPIAKGGYIGSGGKLPFVVRDADGALVAASTLGVSRYPNANDGYAVVEVSAPVQCPSGQAAGAMADYSVLYSPFDGPPEPAVNDAGAYLDATPGLLGEIRSLLQQSGSLLLRTQDVDGNIFQLDLLEGSGSIEKIVFGPTVARLRTYGVMKLVQAGNGGSNLDKTSNIDNPLGRMFVRSLELGVPNGYSVEQEPRDPSFDNVHVTSSSTHTFIKLIKERSDGNQIYFPARFILNRYLAIFKNGQAKRAIEALQHHGLGFAKRGKNAQGNALLHWSNPVSANFLASRLPTPFFDAATQAMFKSKYQGMMQGMYNSFTSGTPQTYPMYDNACDGRHAAFEDYGGATGGAFITLDGAPGVEILEGGHRNGLRWAEMLYTATVNRQEAASYNKDGEPTSVEQWVQPNQVVPYEWFSGIKPGNDSMGDLSVDSCQFNYVMNSGKQSPCMNLIDKKDNIDHQHQIRWTLMLRSLAWLANSEMAKDELRNAAEWSHHAAHQYFSPGYCGTPQGCDKGRLMAGLQTVNSAPNTGVQWGREDGWELDDFATGYAVARDLLWRQKKYDTLKIWAMINAKAVMDCGPDIDGGAVIWRGNDGKVLASIMSSGIGVKDEERAQQTWEDSIVQYAGQLGNYASVLEGQEAALATALADSMQKVARFQTSAYAFAGFGSTTADQIALGANTDNASFQPRCKVSDVPSKYLPDYWFGSTQSANFYSGRMFASGFFLILLTKNNLAEANYFLQRAATSYGQGSTTALLNYLLTQTKNSPGYLQNRASLIAALQIALGLN